MALSSNPAVATLQRLWRDEGPGDGETLPAPPAGPGGWGGFTRSLSAALRSKGLTAKAPGHELEAAFRRYLDDGADWVRGHPLHLFVKHLDKWWTDERRKTTGSRLFQAAARAEAEGR